jgi:hypothetical protein
MADASQLRIVGYEILRKVEPAELPEGYSVNPRTERAVLGARDRAYLIPPGIDVLELGVIQSAGRFELLPIDVGGKPLWDQVVDLIVTDAEAERQRGILLRAYRAVLALILEADELESSVAEWSRRRETHPVFGMLRLETIEVWKSKRRGSDPLDERELDALHQDVARRVAARIGAHVIR